jgi:glycosyltransferase involved in cell wall biosynthesis
MDYMMAGKPILHSVSAGNDPVAEVGCGITVPPNDPVAIASAAINLLKLNKEELRWMGKQGEIFVVSERSYSVLAKNFLKILEK